MFKNLTHIFKNMGAKYVFYRVRHEIEKRSGLLKRRHPNNLMFGGRIEVADWIKSDGTKREIAKESINHSKSYSSQLKEKADRILSGEIQFFNAEWMKLGRDNKWIHL